MGRNGATNHPRKRPGVVVVCSVVPCRTFSKNWMPSSTMPRPDGWEPERNITANANRGFYGADDKNKKLDKNVADSAEDFMVNAGGNFKWITDEDGNLRPVSRMKQTSVEKPAKMWGRQDTTPM